MTEKELYDLIKTIAEQIENNTIDTSDPDFKKTASTIIHALYHSFPVEGFSYVDLLKNIILTVVSPTSVIIKSKMSDDMYKSTLIFNLLILRLEQNDPNLESVELKIDNKYDYKCDKLSKALEVNTHLTKFVFNSTSMFLSWQDGSIMDLIEGLDKNKSITHLALGRNMFEHLWHYGGGDYGGDSLRFFNMLNRRTQFLKISFFDRKSAPCYARAKQSFKDCLEAYEKRNQLIMMQSIAIFTAWKIFSAYYLGREDQSSAMSILVNDIVGVIMSFAMTNLNPDALNLIKINKNKVKKFIQNNPNPNTIKFWEPCKTYKYEIFIKEQVRENFSISIYIETLTKNGLTFFCEREDVFSAEKFEKFRVLLRQSSYNITHFTRDLYKVEIPIQKVKDFFTAIKINEEEMNLIFENFKLDMSSISSAKNLQPIF